MKLLGILYLNRVKWEAFLQIHRCRYIDVSSAELQTNSRSYHGSKGTISCKVRDQHIQLKLLTDLVINEIYSKYNNISKKKKKYVLSHSFPLKPEW